MPVPEQVRDDSRASPYNTFSRKFGVFERFLLVYCVICKHLLVQIGLNRLY